MIKRIITYLTVVLLFVSVVPSMKAEAANTGSRENVVVVIDPGHGGKNLGGQFGYYTEKNMTLITAMAMKQELEEYEGITVYLTRTTDTEYSLAQRAQLGQNVQADYLISLHYNMSAQHSFYGAEVWVPSTGQNFSNGYALGDLFLAEFMKKGTFNRGIKTKVNQNGLDYYGIMRESTLRGIPSILVEHCHLDHANDIDYFDAKEDMESFGRDDATAVAKYFGLTSKKKNVDYSAYPKGSVPAPSFTVMQDKTPPEIAVVQVNSVDSAKNQAGQQLNLTFTAMDSQSGLLYYQYSLDKGVTWSTLIPYPQGQESVTFQAPATLAGERFVIARAYNGYDGMTESLPVPY